MKIVEIVIIKSSMEGDFTKMKQQVLKALANPPHLFGVPYTLAVINFAAQFVLFIFLYIIGIFIFKENVNDYLNPLYFLISVCLVHMALARFTKKDAQLGQILTAKIKILRNNIPRRLAA